MKTKKLLGLIIALALMICAFAVISVANAQECSWDLYVDGKPYDSNASYATSGQVKWEGNGAIVYLNNFTGKSLVAIPNGFIGDDDAPDLLIKISGENRLTGSYISGKEVYTSKPSSGKYWLGALYAETRDGGYGRDSRVRISGSGSLNISISNSLKTKEDITAVVAGDSFVVSDHAKVTISYGGYGVNNCRLIAADTPKINVTGSAVLEVSALANTFASKDKKIKSDCSVEAFGEASVSVNTLGYLSTDIRTQNMGTTDPICNDITVDKNSALYIAVPESTGYTIDGISTSGEMAIYTAETESWKYRAYTPLTISSSSLLKPVLWNDVFANTVYPKYGDAKTEAAFVDMRSSIHCFLKLEAEKYPNGYTGGSAGTTDSFSKYDGLFKFTHTVVPAPGYYVNPGVTKSNLKYSSAYPISKSATNAVNVVYSYNKFSITNSLPAYLCGALNESKNTVLEVTTSAGSGNDLTYEWELQEEVWGGSLGYERLSDTVYDYAVTDKGSKLEIDGQYFYRAFDDSDITIYDTVTFADIRCKVTLMPSNQTVTSSVCSYSNGHAANMSKYVVDGTLHYRPCLDPECTKRLSSAAHSDTNKDGVCDVCKQSGLPVITKQPQDCTASSKGIMEFSVEATGSNLQYQWYRTDGVTTKPASGAAIVTGSMQATIKGDTTTGDASNNMCSANGWKYYCVVSNEYGSVESEKAVLNVNHSIFYNKSYKWDAETHEFSCYCGEKIIGNHTFDDGKITVEPTCTEEGEKTFTCKDCGYPRKEAVEAKGHSFTVTVSPEIPATCLAAGKTAVIKCANCDAVTGGETIAKSTIHTASEAVKENVNAATCSGAGSYDSVVYCSVCHKEMSRSTVNEPVKEHTPGPMVTENVIPASCTEEGSHNEVIYCTVCSAVISRSTVTDAKTAHTYENKPTKATLTADGVIESTCKECGLISSSSVILKASGVKLSAASFVYNGKVQKPTLTVKDSKGNVIAASNYTAVWSNASSKAVGTYTVKITFKGNYSGTKTLTYKILPQQVTGLKASTVAKTSVKLTWAKVTGAKYYKVEQSTDGKTWKAVATVSTNSATVKSLKAGTKYQFRVTALDSTKKLAGKVSAVLKTGTLTAAPTVTLKSSKSKTATASWKKVSGASKYVVYKSTDGKKWTKVTTTTKLTYTLSKLSGGKKIYVKVTAVNAYSKESAASKAVNVTVKK